MYSIYEKKARQGYHSGALPQTNVKQADKMNRNESAKRDHAYLKV